MLKPAAALLVSTAVLLAACSGSSDQPVNAAPSGTVDAGAPVSTPPSTHAPGDAGSDGDAGNSTLTADYFPPATGTWETVSAAEAGFDQAKLDEVSTFVEQSNSTTFMVLYDGRILVEKYWNGRDATTLQDVASAQKSVLSMLIGSLISKGTLSFDATVTSILGAGWSNATAQQEAPITMRQILTMTSCLDANLGYAAPAGSTWLYNTDAYHRNGLVVEAKTGKTLQDYTRSTLFDPIGVGTSMWSTRGGAKDSKGMLVDALLMNARDMARVGLLVMHGGTWAGTTIVPSSYMSEAIVTSQTFNPSYGLLFWLNGKSSALLPPALPFAGMLMPDAPHDLVAALGANDQKIHASTSAKMVVVRQGAAASGEAMAATAWDNQVWQHLDAARTSH